MAQGSGSSSVRGSRRAARTMLPLAGARRDRAVAFAGLPRDALIDLLIESGGSRSAASATAAKLVRWFHARPLGADDAPDRAALSIGPWADAALATLDFAPTLGVRERVESSDGTVRLALGARDGAVIETVLIPGPQRTTVCISSQVGCARGCTFCETARLGLMRHLESAEIVDQVRIATALGTTHMPHPVSNVVFMGMGEPFDNLAAVARATHVLSDDAGLAISPSRITVSTVGVADKLGEFFRTARGRLAVSLNAPDDARRSRVMPVNDRFDLATLKASLLAVVPGAHKILFEYVLIAGVNDALDDARMVADFLRGMRARLNVIPLNAGPDETLRPPTDEAMDAFTAELRARGVIVLVRRTRGDEVGGACGQLAGAVRGRLLPAPSSA